MARLPVLVNSGKRSALSYQTYPDVPVAQARTPASQVGCCGVTG